MWVVCSVGCGPLTSALMRFQHFLTFQPSSCMFDVSSASVPSPLLPVKCRFGCSTCHLLNLPAFIFCFSRTKALVLELLAAVCLVRGGHEIILSAFDNFKEVRACAESGSEETSASLRFKCAVSKSDSAPQECFPG